MIVGRGAELHRIDELLAGARAGRSGRLMLRGEAGIGKSTLLGEARTRAGDALTLSMIGVETEAELAHSGLTDLLRPVADRLDDLPPAQAEALGAALALRPGPADPLAVAAGLLGLLAALAEEQPVVVLVDDAQWVDEASIAALAFAVRRLTFEPVAVLVAVRGDGPTPLAGGPDEELVVEGLAPDDARRLLVDRVPAGGADVDALVDVAAGNPLALLELPEVVDDASAGAADGGAIAPLPVGPRVMAAFGDRLARLPGPTRFAAGLVAAAGPLDAVDLAVAFAEVDLAGDALLPAEHDGLVAVRDGRVELRHPLLRSVAYHALSAPARRAVHRALAAALDQPGRDEVRAWHLAAAADGPDDGVADALDQVAARVERRGAPAAAARGLERSAALTADPDRRARRLLRSAEAWLAAGHWSRAFDRLDEAARHALDQGLRADVAASLGQLEVYRSGPEVGISVLLAAADAIEATDPGRATRLLTYAVHEAVFGADVGRAVALGHRADSLGERAGGLDAVSGTMAYVEAGLMAGDPAVPSRLAPLEELAEALIDSDLADAEHVFGLVVLGQLVLERWDEAERLLEVMVGRARRTGRSFLLAPAVAIRAEIAFRRGRWDEAYLTATTELWEAPTDLAGVGAWLHAVQARIEAGMGLEDDARRHGREAIEVAGPVGFGAVEAWAEASLGFLELGLDRPLAAVGHLSRVAELMDGGGFGEPGILWWAGDLIEALWRTGEVGAARDHLAVLDRRAEATGRRWARGVAARGRGLLAPSAASAEEAFAVALDAHRHLDAPFETARTWLVQGERRRQLGQGDPEAPLRQALDVFGRLGADPWAARARRLLGEGAGEGPGPPWGAAPSLTRQERQVAAIVAAGATNREAAERLFLSPRTVDFHLGNIYRKLGVRSRTELAVLVASRRDLPVPSPGG